MKKYLYLFQITVAQYLVYRFNIFFDLLNCYITPLFSLVLVSQAQANSSVSIASLSSYYLLIGVMWFLTRSSVDSTLNEMAETGDVNNFLLKPISLYSWLLAKEISLKVSSLLVGLPVLIIVILVVGGVHLASLPLAIVGLISAMWISFSLSYLIGLGCFWMEDFWAITNVKEVLMLLLGGVIVPYALFPDSLLVAIKFTPFPYVVSLPVRLLQNQASVIDIVICLIWGLLLYGLTMLIEKKAISNYSTTA